MVLDEVEDVEKEDVVEDEEGVVVMVLVTSVVKNSLLRAMPFDFEMPVLMLEFYKWNLKCLLVMLQNEILIFILSTTLSAEIC